MGRESEIGHDPLGWMKAAKDKKTGQLANARAAEIHTSPDNSGHVGIQPAHNRQIPFCSSKNNPPDIQKPIQQQDKAETGTGTAATHGSKVVIGRLYDKASQEKERKPLPVKDKDTDNEIRHRTEQPLSEISKLQDLKKQRDKIKLFPFSASSSQLSIYFVIAYTVLLLILGYFVFSDFSKRAKSIEARISSLEKVIQEKISLPDETR